MSYQITRPDADQLKFTSAKTGDWVLEDYLQNAELGSRTIATLLTDLFDPATGILRTLASPAEVATAIAAAVAASSSASAASTSASGAASSASGAAASASSAASSLAAVNTVFDTFDDRFLGTKTSDPTVDNDGNPILAGAVYYNSATSQVRFYNGAAWEAPAASATSSATNAATSATNSAGSAAGSATSAAASAASATASAGSAATSSTQATTATTQASNSATSATASSSSAVTATTQASNASTSATAAASSAASAASSATTAATQATNASASAVEAAASYDSFDDRYLGSKATSPALDNDGNALLTGALYWNSTSSEMRVYDGAAWVGAYLPSGTYVAGPASAVNSRVVFFDGITGKLIKDSGLTLSGSNTGDQDLSGKQDALVSGTSIKTINSASLLGSGDVAVQAALVSGTSIKTINSASLLGAGDVTTGDVTLTGVQSLTNKTITDIVFALTGTTPAFTATNGAVQTWSLTAASTPTNSLTTGQSIILVITPGAYAITWPSVTWTKVGGSGAAPTLFSAGKTTVILWMVGAVLYGSHLGDTA